MEIAKLFLKICFNFEKNSNKNFLFVQSLQLFLYFDDSQLENAITPEVIQELLKVFDVCRRSDIIHKKVFQIFQKIPLKINSDITITNNLKNFCYYSKIEKSSTEGKTMTNVSTHFLYQLMEFFEFKGDNEYDGILQTWMEELKELFGKKLLMESDMSDLEESHLRQSGLEINADFNFFGESPTENPQPSESAVKTGFFEFDFTQPPKNLIKSETDTGNEGFGMSQGEFDDRPLLGSKEKINHLETFDFDQFDNFPKDKTLPESPIKNSTTRGKRDILGS